MPKLRIKGLERELEAESGTDVRKACIRSHVNLFWSPWARLFNCRGVGLCGACPVRVLESNGNLPPRTKHEKKRLSKRPDDWRLACQLEVRSDLVLEPFPRVDVEEVVGQEAVRRAQLDEAERKELFENERKERLEARRAFVEEVLADRKKRRSKLLGFFMKRVEKVKGKKDEEGGKPKKEKKEKKGKGEKERSGGLAGRLKRKEKGGDEDEGDGPGGPPKKKGFKLGKGKGKKKEEAPAKSGGGSGGKDK